MTTPRTHTKLITGIVLAIVAAALVAPSAGARPLPPEDDNASAAQPNQLGSKLDRLMPTGGQSVGIVAVPDVFERAVARSQDTVAVPDIFERAVVRGPVEPQLEPVASTSGDGGSSFDWGLFATLIVIGVGVGLGGATLMASRDRGRVAHP
jgi:hypothetical protein